VPRVEKAYSPSRRSGLNSARPSLELDVNIFHSRTHIDPGEVAAAAGTGAVIGAIAPGAGKRSGGRLRDEANAPLSPVGSAVHPHVPPYPGDSHPTSGVFSAKGTEVPLVSGKHGPGEYLIPNDRLPGGPGSGKNAMILTHVEGHAAGAMQKHGIKDADLYINQAPCGKGGQCRFNLGKIIPPGSSLRVHFPDSDGTVKTWLFQHGVPKWRELQ
jgi:hypothetical protein